MVSLLKKTSNTQVQKGRACAHYWYIGSQFAAGLDVSAFFLAGSLDAAWLCVNHFLSTACNTFWLQRPVSRLLQVLFYPYPDDFLMSLPAKPMEKEVADVMHRNLTADIPCIVGLMTLYCMTAVTACVWYVGLSCPFSTTEHLGVQQPATLRSTKEVSSTTGLIKTTEGATEAQQSYS